MRGNLKMGLDIDPCWTLPCGEKLQYMGPKTLKLDQVAPIKKLSSVEDTFRLQEWFYNLIIYSLTAEKLFPPDEWLPMAAGFLSLLDRHMCG